MYSIKPELVAFIRKNMKKKCVMTPITMREGSMVMAQSQELPKVELAGVEDTVLDSCGEYDVPVRIYIPSKEKALPVLIYYHGGGFSIDNVTVYDPVCRRIARATGYIVVSPEYRLAPENKYPAAEADAKAVVRRILPKLETMHIPYARDITVCGDSAGGYLAAVVSAAFQGSDSVPLTHQILIYPCLDMTHSLASVQENCSQQTGFTKEKLHWYFSQYFRPADDRVKVSPLFSRLTEAMPATLVFTAQFCPFRDEGQDYVRRLRERGVRAVTYNYTNMVHSYLNFEKICYDEICDTYRRMREFLR